MTRNPESGPACGSSGVRCGRWKKKGSVTVLAVGYDECSGGERWQGLVGHGNGGGYLGDDDAPSYGSSAAPPPCLPQNAMFDLRRRMPQPVAISGRRRQAHLNRRRYIIFARDRAWSDFRKPAQDDRSLREDIF